MRWTPDRPGFVTVGDTRLEIRCWGPPPAQAMTLVLLHEGLGSISLWRDIPEALVGLTGCGVLAWSRAGYGQSDPADLPRPMDYMTREALEVLPDILDVADLRRMVLIGHSDGASIAAIYAGKRFDPRLKGLVLIAPHFFAEPAGLAAIKAAKTAYETTDLRDRLARHHRDPDNAFYGWNDAWLTPEFNNWNIAPVIDAITVPVLAIQGEDDEYATMAQIDTLQTRLRPRLQKLLLAGCKHAPQVEHRARTLAAIQEFGAMMQDNA